MNKAQFVEEIKRHGNYATKAEAEEALKAVINAIEGALISRKKISILGFGLFETVEQKGKTGKIPNSDRTYITENKFVPKFKASKILKDRVSSGE